MHIIDRELFEEGLRLVPRVFRDRTSPFETLDDESFRMRYRFTRAGFFKLVKYFEIDLTRSRRGKSLLPAQRLAMTLQILASNCFQITASDLAGCHQSTACRIFQEVVEVIFKRMREFIYWPNSEEALKRSQREFYAITGIPNVVGAIDRTHVRILAPKIMNMHSLIEKATTQ